MSSVSLNFPFQARNYSGVVQAIDNQLHQISCKTVPDCLLSLFPGQTINNQNLVEKSVHKTLSLCSQAQKCDEGSVLAKRLETISPENFGVKNAYRILLLCYQVAYNDSVAAAIKQRLQDLLVKHKHEACAFSRSEIAFEWNTVNRAFEKQLELADQVKSKDWSYGKMVATAFAGVAVVATTAFLAYRYTLQTKNDNDPNTKFCVYEKKHLSAILGTLQFKDGKEQSEFFDAMVGSISVAAKKAVDRGQNPVQVALASCENRKNLQEVNHDKDSYWKSITSGANKIYTELKERGFSALSLKAARAGVFPIIKTRSCEELLVEKYQNDPNKMIEASGRTNSAITDININQSFIKDLDWNCSPNRSCPSPYAKK